MKLKREIIDDIINVIKILSEKGKPPYVEQIYWYTIYSRPTIVKYLKYLERKGIVKVIKGKGCRKHIILNDFRPERSKPIGDNTLKLKDLTAINCVMCMLCELLGIDYECLKCYRLYYLSCSKDCLIKHIVKASREVIELARKGKLEYLIRAFA